MEKDGQKVREQETKGSRAAALRPLEKPAQPPPPQPTEGVLVVVEQNADFEPLVSITRAMVGAAGFCYRETPDQRNVSTLTITASFHALGASYRPLGGVAPSEFRIDGGSKFLGDTGAELSGRIKLNAKNRTFEAKFGATFEPERVISGNGQGKAFYFNQAFGRSRYMDILFKVFSDAWSVDPLEFAIRMLVDAHRGHTTWFDARIPEWATNLMHHRVDAMRLTSCLTNEDLLVRRCAADALGRIGDKVTMSALLGALTDSDAHVAGAAATALRGMGWVPRHEQAFDFLQRMAASGDLSEIGTRTFHSATFGEKRFGENDNWMAMEQAMQYPYKVVIRGRKEMGGAVDDTEYCYLIKKENADAQWRVKRAWTSTVRNYQERLRTLPVPSKDAQARANRSNRETSRGKPKP